MDVPPMRFSRRRRSSRASAAKDTSDAPSWHAFCQLDQNGNPIANLANACIALEHDHDFAGKFQFDQMLCAPVFDGRLVEDPELVALHRSLQVKGLRRISSEIVHEAVRAVAYNAPIHPLRDLLLKLRTEWDGTTRSSNWTTVYLGTANEEPNHSFGFMFLIAMVARIFQPGCQQDYTLVLEGDQGEMKSQACRVLASPTYFSSHLPPLGGDEVRLSAHLRGKWLIEISELSAFRRASREQLKAFLSRQEEIYTPKYYRVEVREPRQCCFICTTNEEFWNFDDTGARRFWPIKCGTIDLNALRRDRDQLIGEAVELYHQDKQWWPERDFEKTIIRPVQAERLWVDAWDGPVRLLNPTQAKYSIAQLAELALGLKPDRFSVPDQRRLAAVLRRVGWMSKRGNSGVFWQPPCSM